MSERQIRSMSHQMARPYLAEGSIAEIEEATRSVLQRTGVQLKSPSLLERLAQAGATVDVAEERVRFSGAAIDKALAQVPRGPLVLAAREAGLDVVLDGSAGFLALDGGATETLDLATGERRESTLQDVADLTRLADALDDIGLMLQPVFPRDIPSKNASIHALRAQFENTSKHIVVTMAYNARLADAAIKLATIAAGGTPLVERPIISSMQFSSSPLTWDAPAIEASLSFAAAGVPAGFMTMPIAASTAPSTPAGTMVVANAEALAAVVMLQMLAPGSSVFYGCQATAMDLRLGVETFGGPEDMAMQMTAVQLARHYGIPVAVGTFQTAAKTSDWQAGTENALSVAASWHAGADIMIGAGLLYGTRVHSAQQIILDSELYRIGALLAAGFEYSDECLADEVIATVGPGSHFLGEQHTRDHMREIFRSDVLSRETWEDWELNGRPAPRDRAKTKAERLLGEHQPMPLPDGAADQMDALIGELG